MTVFAGLPVDIQVTTPDVVLYVRDKILGDPKSNKDYKKNEVIILIVIFLNWVRSLIL